MLTSPLVLQVVVLIQYSAVSIMVSINSNGNLPVVARICLTERISLTDGVWGCGVSAMVPNSAVERVLKRFQTDMCVVVECSKVCGL